MENPPQILTPTRSGRRRSNDSNSPEFEFWMGRNPSFGLPSLVSADELFVDGILLPRQLHHRHKQDPPDPPPVPAPNQEPESEPASGPELSSLDPVATASTVSKRWKDIFKKSTNRKHSGSNGNNEDNKEKEKKREKKGGGGVNGVSSAELNINIWPFSRSRSAGNSGSRPRVATATRKVSSAPCSRSNSAGESKSRKWPSSPSRGGVHLGRSSPVWQVKRGGSAARGSDPVGRNAEKGVKKEGHETRRSKLAGAGRSAGSGGSSKGKVLNINVPMCIGYRSHLSCRSDDNSMIGVLVAGDGGAAAQTGGVGAGDGGRSSNHLFNLRNLFTKKVY